MTEDKGFSLVEVLVAIAIVVGGAVSVAQLSALSSHSLRSAHASSAAWLLAQQKLEALRAESSGLEASPPGTLESDTDRFVDYMAADGTSIGAGGASAPPGTVYIRRWSVGELSGGSRAAWLLQVAVIPWNASGTAASAAARLFTVTRRPA